MNSNKLFCENVEQLLDIKSSSKTLISALKKLLPNKDDHVCFVISFILGTIFSIIVALDSNTLKIVLSTLGTILNMLIGIFGCVFTVFSIIVAVSNDSFIKILSTYHKKSHDQPLNSTDKNKNSLEGKSILVKCLSYFESVLYIYFLGLIITGLLLLFLKLIPNNFVLTINKEINKIIVIVPLLLYYTFVFRILLELKSTIWNAVILFRLSLANKNLDFFEESLKKSNEESKDGNK